MLVQGEGLKLSDGGNIMKRMFFVLLALLTSTVLVGAPAQSAQAATGTPKAVNGKKVTSYLRAAIKNLPVRAEVRTGYVRSKFKLWDDVNHDCQNTRAEVLAQESHVPTSGGCTIATGRWVSYYDGQVITDASQLDIDHVVPLAEAWDSGARAWSAAKREAYANDLTDKRPLVAVSASANRSKGDSDPAQWMPTFGQCRYIMQWTVTKVRWGLSVDGAEKRQLRRIASHCPNRRFTTHKAVVTFVGRTTSSSSTTSGGGTSSASLDPRFSTCTEAIAHGYGPYYAGRDPEYYWYEDRDHDGIVCE